MPQHVCGGKAEELNAGGEEVVLPAVVRGQTLAMVRSVVLDDKTRGRIVQVRSRDKTTVVIAQGRLNFRLGQAGLQQNPSEACLHRRLRGSRTSHNASENPGARTSPCGVCNQRGDVGALPEKRHVYRNQGIENRRPGAQIAESSRHDRHAVTSSFSDVVRIDR